jgi:hydroxymethylpyrimidine pyrophosphatase-like HAD family hydrolase
LRTRLIAIDMDGTLVGLDGKVSARNFAALKAADQAGIEVVVATGRRHSYAMRLLHGLGLSEDDVLISSNGAVVRTVGARLIERTLLSKPASEWLCGHLGEYRNALVITFDRVGPDGEDSRGSLVVEQFEYLQASIERWMIANEPYILQVEPIERSLDDEKPIQMMLCGTVERMRRAEALLLADPRVAASATDGLGVEITLSRTEYPARDLSIVDILPAGCSKGAALHRLAISQGIRPEEILAIGDNWNDLSMLEMAGHAVLMENAPEDLKVLARERGWAIGGRHEDDAVAVAIEAVLNDRETEFANAALSGTL